VNKKKTTIIHSGTEPCRFSLFLPYQHEINASCGITIEEWRFYDAKNLIWSSCNVVGLLLSLFRIYFVRVGTSPESVYIGGDLNHSAVFKSPILPDEVINRYPINVRRKQNPGLSHPR